MNIIVGIEMIVVLEVIEEAIVNHSYTAMHVTPKTLVMY
jgi:hypothetical protein